jgi:hypothetical protein
MLPDLDPQFLPDIFIGLYRPAAGMPNPADGIDFSKRYGFLFWRLPVDYVGPMDSDAPASP